MDNQKTFNWDDEISNESSFVIFPAGNYKFTVEGFEREYYGGGPKIPPCNKANLTLKIEDELGRHVTINDGLFLCEVMEWKLCSFFTAIGLRKHGEKVRMAWDKIIGRSGMCKIFIDEYEKNGKKYQNNKVDSYLDPEQFPITEKAPASGWKAGQF